MSELAQNAAKMMDMLPAAEQMLAYEMLKRIVLARQQLSANLSWANVFESMAFELAQGRV